MSWKLSTRLAELVRLKHPSDAFVDKLLELMDANPSHFSFDADPKHGYGYLTYTPRNDEDVLSLWVSDTPSFTRLQHAYKTGERTYVGSRNGRRIRKAIIRHYAPLKEEAFGAALKLLIS